MQQRMSQHTTLVCRCMCWQQPWMCVYVAAAQVLQGAPPTAADVGRLPGVLAVVLEALRCYPPAYLVGRCANRPVELGGRYALPAGTTVLVRWAGGWRLLRSGRWRWLLAAMEAVHAACGGMCFELFLNCVVCMGYAIRCWPAAQSSRACLVRHSCGMCSTHCCFESCPRPAHPVYSRCHAPG